MKNREQIIATLSFWSLFNKGVSTEMLTHITQIPPKTLNKLLLQMQIRRKNNHWVLGSKYQPLNKKIHTQQEKLIDKNLPLLRFIPGVKAIAVCNSYSLKTTSTKSDIDLLIVTNPKLLFTARLLVTLYFQFKRIRRHDNLIRNRFCLSFFVTTNSLNFQRLLLSKDYYFYYWFRTLQWYILPEPLSKWSEILFLANNSWLKIFTVSTSKSLFLQPKWQLISKPNKIISLILSSSLEPIIKLWQIKRAQKKQKELGNPKGVIIEKQILKFHVIDKRQEFNQQLAKIITTLQKS